MKKSTLLILVLTLFVSIAGAWTRQTSDKLYSADVSTLTANADYTVESSAIDVSWCEAVSVHAYGTAQSTNATSNVTVYFITSPNGRNWDTKDFTSLAIVMNTTSAATMQGALIDVSGIKWLKVWKVNNANTSYAIYNFNVWCARKRLYQ